MAISPLLLIHVCSGTVGLLSGTVAIAVRKGSRTHAVSGVIFSYSMLSLAVSGTYLACTRAQVGNILGGVLTFYMIATGWRAGRRGDGQTSPFDWLALLFAMVVGTACIFYGVRVAQGRMPAHGVPAAMDFFFGFILLVAGIGDIRMIARGGIAGTRRVTRHLWRMCFGLFIASGSFFMGRQQIFPALIRQSNILIILTVLPLILMIFWLVRVRFTKVHERKFLQHADDAYSVTN